MMCDELRAGRETQSSFTAAYSIRAISMKISREFWFVAAALLIPFAGFWLLMHAPMSQLRQFEEQLSFPVTIFLLSMIFLAVVISRNLLPIRSAIKNNPTPLFVWLFFWLAAFSFIFFQHMQQVAAHSILSLSMAPIMLFITGLPTFALTQKPQEEKRVVWLTIAGLSYICACISVYAGWIG